MNYTFANYLHNYSVWTASRAVQRGYTTTKNIKDAIEKTELSNLEKISAFKSSPEFDNFHRQTSEILIRHLSNLGIPTTYGRAAKIIAIYLKTSIIIRDSGESLISKIIHPPIDRILLTNLSRENGKSGFTDINWTQLTDKEYYELIDALRKLGMESFWKLEKFWTPN